MESVNNSNRTLESLKQEIRVKAKLGIDFILAASVAWFGIFIIWRYTSYSSYDKSVLTFIFGAILLPLAATLSKLFKTEWKIKDNPLQPLGLWLNFAQLIYFPFLIFALVKTPDYFIMAYAIITGAHLFPYAWFYNEPGYSVAAIIISVGSMVLAMTASAEIFYIPLFTASALLLLAIWILFNNTRV